MTVSLESSPSGSSPRMRGALNGHHALHVCRGIIPAYAGSTRLAHRWRCRRTDHPRVCGEHLHECQRTGLDPGSSPRMRGAHLHINTRKYGAGIIPAYAGSTCMMTIRCGELKDHPRVCGEHMELPGSYGAGMGSSPRMRGAPGDEGAGREARRIIPAYAGSTAGFYLPQDAYGDHPRVCGEHRMDQTYAFAIAGSSPRMRGARGAQAPSCGERGIIPAYAGSTWFILESLESSRDHPRVCGEHLAGL